MARGPRWVLGLVVAVSLTLGACGAPSPSADTPRPEIQPSAVQAGGPTNGATGTLNIEAIFPPGRGRELVLNNCTSCHNITPIVTLQMTTDAWALNSREHRERVTSVSDADFAALYEYLAANFNPHKPVPELPKELLDQWTSY